MIYKAFDDVLLLPQYSDIESRDDVDISQSFLGLNLKVPVLSANMSTVTEYNMTKAMYHSGGMGILHRFVDSSIIRRWVHDLYEDHIPVNLSVGLREWPYPDEHFFELASTVTIDIAHGHTEKMFGAINYLKGKYPHLMVIAGNVATKEGFRDLALAGADAIKVGIGPGAACTTRLVTGVGVPQLSAIQQCYDAKREHYTNVKIIADGGIKNTGDMVKALAAGADVVMLGRLLAGTHEAAGAAVKDGEAYYKQYVGQSTFGVNGARNAPEGVAGHVKVEGFVKDVMTGFSNSIKSSLSYQGAKNLQELREGAIFVDVSPGTILESGPRV